MTLTNYFSRINRKTFKMFGFLISMFSSLVNLPLGLLFLNAFPILINDELLIYIYASLRGVKGLYTPWCDVVAATLIIYFFFKTYIFHRKNLALNPLILTALLTISFSFLVGVARENADLLFLAARYIFGVIYILGAHILSNSKKANISFFVAFLVFFQTTVVILQLIYNPAIFSDPTSLNKILTSKQYLSQDSFDYFSIIRPMGTFSNPNQLAEYMLMLISITFIIKKDYNVYMFRILAILELFLLFVTFSKTSIASFILVAIFSSLTLFILWIRRINVDAIMTILTFTSILFSILLFIFVYYIPQNSVSLVSELFRIYPENILGQRSQIYSYISDNLISFENIVFGVGFEGWAAQLKNFDLTSPHSLFFELIVGNGVIGFIYILAVVCTVFRNLYILLKQIQINFNYIVPSYMVIAIIFVRGSFASVSLLDWNYSTMIILWIILEINSYTLTSKPKKNINLTTISNNSYNE